MNELFLTAGFTKEDAQRVKYHLQKLIPHLQKDQFIIVGGLAIRYHLISHGINYPIRQFNDLDIVAKSARVVLPSVTEDFLVYHYHPQKGKEFYVVLLDPQTRTKVDIFDYQFAPQEVIKVSFGKEMISIQSIEDQLVKTVLDIQRISEKAKVDPKQFSDTRLLMQIADMRKADKFWKARDFSQYPHSILEAIERAEAIRRVHPEWIQEKPFHKTLPYNCPNCVNTEEFPLTPMSEIYKILGYTE